MAENIYNVRFVRPIPVMIPEGQRPHDNPQVIKAVDFKERHRNANVFTVYKPIVNPIVKRNGTTRVTYRIIMDNGRETIKEKVIVARAERQGHQDVKTPMSRDTFDRLTRCVITADMHDIIEETCVMCHSSFAVGDECILTDCIHRFHTACIKGWFLEESNLCPTCRGSCGPTIHEELRSHREQSREPRARIRRAEAVPQAVRARGIQEAMQPLMQQLMRQSLNAPQGEVQQAIVEENAIFIDGQQVMAEQMPAALRALFRQAMQ